MLPLPNLERGTYDMHKLTNTFHFERYAMLNMNSTCFLLIIHYNNAETLSLALLQAVTGFVHSRGLARLSIRWYVGHRRR